MPLHELDTRFVNYRDPIDYTQPAWYRPEEYCQKQPTREVYCEDAIKYLQNIENFGENTSVFTSIPDISEIPEFVSNNKVQEYKEWFTKVAYLIMSRLNEKNSIIFLQSDTKILNKNSEIIEWINKFFLIFYSANLLNCTLLWHKFVSLKELNKVKKNCGRPNFSHLFCFVKNSKQNSSNILFNPLEKYDFSLPLITPKNIEKKTKKQKKLIKSEENIEKNDEKNEKSDEKNEKTEEKTNSSIKDSSRFSYKPGLFRVPDLFYRGEMLWTRGIGLNSCYVGTIFLRDVMKAKTVVDPFCGVGTALAMANLLGMDAIGVELSAKRCKKAKLLTIAPCLMEEIPEFLRDVTSQDGDPSDDEDEEENNENDKKKKKKKEKNDRKKKSENSSSVSSSSSAPESSSSAPDSSSSAPDSSSSAPTESSSSLPQEDDTKTVLEGSKDEEN